MHRPKYWAFFDPQSCDLEAIPVVLSLRLFQTNSESLEWNNRSNLKGSAKARRKRTSQPVALLRFQFERNVHFMEYRGVRYTIRARIERDEWLVAIHPSDTEMPGKIMSGDREQAEMLAHSMINKWLDRRQWS